MKKLAILACVALLGASCSQNDKFIDKPAITESENLGQGGDLEISAGVETDMQLELEDESPRSLGLQMPNANTIKYSIDLGRYANTKVNLFIKKKDDSNVTHVEADAKISRGSNGKYRMHIVAEGVRPQGSGNDFRTGEWYVTGYWFADPRGQQKASFNATTGKYNIPQVSPATANALGDKVEVAIPLGFPWTKIEGKLKNTVWVMKNFDLKIRPLGVLLALFPENRTAQTIVLEQLDSELLGFGIGGDFDLSKDPKEGEFPSFTSSGRDNINNKSVTVLPQPITLTSKQKSNSPLYLWAMPETDDFDKNKFMTFTFVSRERSTNDGSLDANDQFASAEGAGKTRDRYPMDVEFKNTPKHSSYYVKTLPIRTGLMITEIFANRVANGTPYVRSRNSQVNTKPSNADYWNDPYFYGYVEIYNPNVDAVNLENFALARIANMRAVSGGRRGPNYPFFHPHAQRLFNKAWGAGQRGLADRRADDYTQSNFALLLSLQLKDGEKSSFYRPNDPIPSGNSLGFLSHLETAKGAGSGSGRMERVNTLYPGNDDRIERVKFFKGGPDTDTFVNGKARLKGGHTMILLGNGFLREDTGNREFTTTWKYWENRGTARYYARESQRDPRTHTPANVADQRIVSLPQAAWEDMLLKNDKCQIIVAVDNFKSITAYANDEGAGVMNLGLNDALFLVQKHNRQGDIRRIIDATSAHPFSRVNNWNDFAQKVTLASETEVAKPHFRVRSTAQEHPEFLNFDYKQWHPVAYQKTGSGSQRFPRVEEAKDLDKHISPGRRSSKDRPY